MGRLGVMLYMDDGFFGFLGKNARSGVAYKTYKDYDFVQCKSIRQCSPQRFTMYGYVIKRRMIQRLGNGTAPAEKMPLIDPFRCGAFGYEVWSPSVIYVVCVCDNPMSILLVHLLFEQVVY